MTCLHISSEKEKSERDFKTLPFERERVSIVFLIYLDRCHLDSVIDNILL